MRPRIFLAEDNILLLEKVSAFVNTIGWVIGTAHDGPSAVEHARRLQPDLIILDISMPLLNGLDAARQIKAQVPGCKIVFLTVHDNTPYIREAMETGAEGYVMKKTLVSDLLPAIRAVLAGERIFPEKAYPPTQEGQPKVTSSHMKD